MLSRDPVKVMAEVLSQAKARDQHLEGAELVMQQYPGAWFTDGGATHSAELHTKNPSFEHISSEMGNMVWANPRWRVSTRRPRAQQLVAEAMHWGMDSWTRDTDLKLTLEDAAVDFEFAWMVLHVSAQPVPESYEAEDPMLYPQLSRLSPWDMGMDHRAPTARRARMFWHRYRIDKEDLEDQAKADRARPRAEREGWDLDAIRSLNTTSAADSWLRHSRRGQKPGSMEGSGWDDVDRQQCEVVSVFFPGMQLPGQPGPDEGFNGTIATYGLSGNGDVNGAVELRKPRGFFGPRWGPYHIKGCYIVPDNPWPLSHLVACAPSNEMAKRVTHAVDQQVINYKRLGITADAVLAKLIKEAPNDTIHTYLTANLDNVFTMAEVGGTTKDNVAAEQRSQYHADRMMGFSEQQRGVTTGATLGEVEIANTGVAAKGSYRRARYQDGVRAAGRTVAWYMYHTDEIVLPLGEDAILALGLAPGEEAWFVGGNLTEGSGMTFDDLGLEIEPMSMERPSEQMLMRHGEFMIQLANMAPMFPVLAQSGADLKGYIDALGDSYGFNKASRLFPGLDSVDWSQMQPQEVEPRMLKNVGLQGAIRNMKRGTVSPTPAGGGGGGGMSRGGGGAGSSRPSPGGFSAGGASKNGRSPQKVGA